jgi:CheY-like chemotaxis protein
MSAGDRLANRHFLVVDDEGFVRTLVARYLKRSGAAGVVEAADGRQAIAAIANYDMLFDVIITDINMRPVNGLELLRAIRTGAGGLKRNALVLMLTAHAEAELVAEALALDADGFVVKPVERGALIDRVVRVLERTVPISPAACYAAIGAGGVVHAVAPPVIEPPALAPAPPTKPLPIVAKDAFPSPLHIGNAADRKRALTPREPAQPVAGAIRVSLGEAKVNSILAADIYLGDTKMLLVAAPVILTKALLDRLKDLHDIADSHLYVIEPAA